MFLEDHIHAEHEIDVDDYCKRIATTDAFGGPLEIEAYVEEKGGAVSVRIWTEVSLNGEKLLREMTHHRGNADAPVIELLWRNGGDAAAGKEGADHYERFEWLGVCQPPLTTAASSLPSSPPSRLLYIVFTVCTLLWYHRQTPNLLWATGATSGGHRAPGPEGRGGRKASARGVRRAHAAEAQQAEGHQRMQKAVDL